MDHCSHSVFTDTERCDDVVGTPSESLNMAAATTYNLKYVYDIIILKRISLSEIQSISIDTL